MVIEAALRDANGDEAVSVFGLIDAAWVSSHRGVEVRISQEMARQAAAGAVTYFHNPTQQAIADEDLVALRTWQFLEAESFRRPMRYRILRPPGGTATQLPPIAELLQLTDSNSRRIVKRIADAASVIRKHDPAYRSLAVIRGVGGVPYLVAFREGGQRPGRGQVPIVMGATEVRPAPQRALPRRISVEKTVVDRTDRADALEQTPSVLESLIANGLSPELAEAFGTRRRSSNGGPRDDATEIKSTYATEIKSTHC